MPTDVLMPALSPTMERGNLIKWIKAVGDKVRPGDIIAEVETDKATMDVEAEVEGVLFGILIQEGAVDVPVNQVIGLIASEEEAAASERTRAAPAAVQNGAIHVAPVVAEAVLPVAPPLPDSHPPAFANGDAGRTFVSPIARRLMKEFGIEAGAIQGTGPNGRIIERDITASPAFRADFGSAAPLSRDEPPSQSSSDASEIRTLFEPGSFDDVAHDSMRLTIARRLAEAKRTVPHFYLTADCGLDALLRLREQFNHTIASGLGGGVRASVNDFIIKGLALALAKTPDANVSFTEQSLLRHRHADIGVAVAIPGGLITPIVRRAETKSLSKISNEMEDLVARASARRLKPDEYQGATASVSNLGMHGVKEFAAILNPPQAIILAVGAAEPRVVARQGAPVVATMMTVTLSADHRAVDGVTAAKLLGAFKALIEEPMALLV